VPADAEIQGRDQYGLKLLSSDAMGSRTVVILGQPLAAEGDTPEHILRNAFSAYFPGCRIGGGLGRPVNGHPAGKAGFSMCYLNREVTGYAEFVLGDGYVMPLICGYPFLPEDLDPAANLHLPPAALQKKYDRQRNGFQACDVISTSTVHDRPTALSDFMVTARDLTPIRGRLVLVLAPYERLIPVTCSYPASQREAPDAICQTITGSVVLR